jgi:hypothetical protein
MKLNSKNQTKIPTNLLPIDPVNQVRLSIRDFELQLLLNGVGASELLGLIPTALLDTGGVEVLIASRTVYAVKAAILANVTRWPGQKAFTLLRDFDFEQTDSLADDQRKFLEPEKVVQFTVLSGV